MKALSEKEIEKKLEECPNWEYFEGAIHTTLEFENFKDCFSIMTRVAFEAEEMQHHPDWTNIYNRLAIALNTHDADGVTDKDFKLAKIIDALVG